jgi:RNA polymerase sigma-70 factor (ECF subfamily)
VDRIGEGQTTWPDGRDRAAFADLVRQHGPPVHAYLSRRAGRQVADDLFSDVWLRAWRSRDSFDPDSGGVLPWLYGIARNTLRAHFRLRVENFGQLFELHSDPWAETDSRLDASRVGIALERALGSLSEELREILLMVAWEQLSPAEIAQSLQMHPGTVRSRLHRARTALRDHLEAELEVPLDSDPQEVC